VNTRTTYSLQVSKSLGAIRTAGQKVPIHRMLETSAGVALIKTENI